MALLNSNSMLQDSIDKKPNLVLQVYSNKANEGADILNPGHNSENTLAILGIIKYS